MASIGNLENLDYLLKEKCIDQTTCNSLIEQVNIDFERKKKGGSSKSKILNGTSFGEKFRKCKILNCSKQIL